MSKANEKQRGNATLCVSHIARTVFGLACIEKVRLVVEVLLEKFHLKRLFSIGSQSCRSLTKNNVGVVLFFGPNAKRVFGLDCTEKKSVQVFRLFENFILKRLFFQAGIKVSKANENQRRSPNFCVGPNAKRVFRFARREKSSSLS